MFALHGILASLHVRNICGIGQKVETSMYKGAMAIRSPMLPGSTRYRKNPDYSNLRQVGVQVLFSETPSSDRLPAANLGQHSVEILQELGFSELEISDLRDARCIGVPWLVLTTRAAPS